MKKTGSERLKYNGAKLDMNLGFLCLKSLNSLNFVTLVVEVIENWM